MQYKKLIIDAYLKTYWIQSFCCLSPAWLPGVKQIRRKRGHHCWMETGLPAMECTLLNSAMVTFGQSPTIPVVWFQKVDTLPCQKARSSCSGGVLCPAKKTRPNVWNLRTTSLIAWISTGISFPSGAVDVNVGWVLGYISVSWLSGQMVTVFFVLCKVERNLGIEEI